MEEIFRRFPGLGKRILHQLDGKSLADCRIVNETLKIFIDQDRAIWAWMIQNQVGKVNITQDWKMLMFKTPTNTVRELATAVSQFYKSNPTFVGVKWSPLHIAAERGILTLCQLIIRKVKDQNPRNDFGETPLFMAAMNGHSEIYNLIIHNVNQGL